MKSSIIFLLVLFFISCGTKHQEYGDSVSPYSSFPQEIELKGEVIELDTAVFSFPFRIRITGDKAIVMDLHGADHYAHLFHYPDFRYMSSVGKRGDSPAEMLSNSKYPIL